MSKSKAEAVKLGLALQERRAFMKLPLEQRRRQMAEQAAQMVRHYEAPTEVIQREEWQGGDVVECS
ncbi:MAG: hypothetical protein WD468_05580 [Pirellulales bacterium]